MLDNYARNEDGTVYQIEKKPFDYTGSYNDYYKNIKFCTRYTSYLRLGYIIGSIGHLPESVLDVGYGAGVFLEACEKEDIDTYGHDISGWPVPQGSTFVEDMKGSYEVITFFDSLEHMEDIEFVKDLNVKYACISVPDCHYFSDEWFDTWKHRKPDEHLWHFNEASLKKFMDRMGYDVLNTCNLEDFTRQNKKDYTNILTGIFKKR